jgi:hypothetical protein
LIASLTHTIASGPPAGGPFMTTLIIITTLTNVPRGVPLSIQHGFITGICRLGSPSSIAAVPVCVLLS